MIMITGVATATGCTTSLYFATPKQNPASGQCEVLSLVWEELEELDLMVRGARPVESAAPRAMPCRAFSSHVATTTHSHTASPHQRSTWRYPHNPPFLSIKRTDSAFLFTHSTSSGLLARSVSSHDAEAMARNLTLLCSTSAPARQIRRFSPAASGHGHNSQRVASQIQPVAPRYAAASRLSPYSWRCALATEPLAACVERHI
jgi:hypothetical protein